jgi:membrane fusion protein, multidrug efflux system
LESPDGFLLGEYVHGRIMMVSREGLAVPRSAVLPEEGRYVLYTVSQGRARKHVVETGLENERVIEVVGKNLKPGDPVVVLGNYELKNGMRVRTEASE